MRWEHGPPQRACKVGSPRPLRPPSPRAAQLEAFAPSHGVRTDDLSLVNFRRGLRDVAFTDVANPPELVDPPPPSQLGSLSEEHVAADETLLEAGAHCGATHEELVRFTEAALRGGAEPEVSLDDGTKAVLMGLAAHRSIETGRAVPWREMLDEFEAARAWYADQ